MMLKLDDKIKMQNLFDITTGSGPAAIQKLGNGQVYGKLAKAVRKLMQTGVKSNSISEIYRINYPNKNTLTLANVDPNSVKTSTGELLSDWFKNNRIDGVTKMPIVKDINYGQSIIAINNKFNKSMPKYGFIRDHEIGHHFNKRTDLSNANTIERLDGSQLNDLWEDQADAFAYWRRNSDLNGLWNVDEISETINKYSPVFESTKINTYPK